MQTYDLGQAVINPDGPVIAGDFVTLTFTYTAGHPIDDSGYLKIAFRSVSDFGSPQFSDPSAPNFCKVETDGDCRIQPRWDPQGHTRPWSKAIYLQVRGGYLDEGEHITVTFGERSGGSPGWQAQTFCVERFEFKTLVDPIATYQFRELPESPAIRIAPGPAFRAVCIAPSMAQVGLPFTYHLKLEDRWGNPLVLPQAFNHPGFKDVGFHYVEAVDNDSGLAARSNPIEATTRPDGHETQPQDGHLHSLPPQLIPKGTLKPYWGDFHGQSEETIGSGSIERYFSFGRDYALLDILGHQGNDFQVTDEFWNKINRMTAEYYQPGKFVTFPGYEYSANTPLGGDRNVYFTAEGGQITRSSCELLPGGTSKYPDSPTAVDLFENLKKQTDHNHFDSATARLEGNEVQPQDGHLHSLPTQLIPKCKPFVFAHVGGRYAALETHDPDLELAVEVHSAWGTFEWLVDEALSRGYRVGIGANSDGHKCRPGASYPGASTFGSYGGLTCVLAESLDREGIYEALKARHFYATSGARMLAHLRLELRDGRSAMMGDVIEAGAETPVLHVQLAGSAPIESVQLRDGKQTLTTLRPYEPETLGKRVKVIWSGAEVRGRDRIANWDGGLSVDGNRILKAEPINFWNADQPLRFVDDQHLSWTSSTTGGLSGVILDLQEPLAGSMHISTTQGVFNLKVSDIGYEPLEFTYGGLEKVMRVYRLPDINEHLLFNFSQSLDTLAKGEPFDKAQGEHPIYIRVEQEDGHLLWTSPVYLEKK